MSMTLEKIRTIMNISEDRMALLLQDTDIPNLPDSVLSGEEIQKIRMVLLRSHQVAPPQDPVTPEPDASEPPVTSAEPAPTEPPPWTDAVDSQMEQLVLSKKIMIDTCSLMHDKCEIMINALLPALQKHRKQIVIPSKVIDELKKHQKDHRDPFKVVSANKGLLLCRKLKEAGCLSIRGTDRDNFADNTFFVAISRYRYEHNILLITQDRKLSQDILRLNDMQAIKGYPVEVRYLNGRGQLCLSSPFTP